MEIERHYYDEALRQSIIDDETEDKIAQMVRDIGKLMEKQIRVLDFEKQAWFEGLSGSIVEFARACNLNVKARITDDLCGVIQFETSFFVLDWRDEPEVHAFWAYLQHTADSFSISHSDEYFRMEYQFHLFSLYQAE